MAKLPLMQRIDIEAVQELVMDLNWDYDRLSKSGKEIYNLLCQHLDIVDVSLDIEDELLKGMD